MQQHQHHNLPNASAMEAMNIEELLSVTLRLSDVMSEESAMLKAMRVSELPKLQAEKMKLGAVLEEYQKRLASDPSFVANVDEKTREELLLRTDDLALSVEENFRQVSVARAVNQRVMQAMMDVMHEGHRPGTYGKQGQTMNATSMALSMNLNQKA